MPYVKPSTNKKLQNLDDGGESIIFWPCACWIFKNFLGEILVCHLGRSIIFWPCACWIFKKYSRWDHGLSYSWWDSDSACTCSKDDWPPWQNRISPRIFLKIQPACGQKIIDPTAPSMTDQDLTYNFKVQNNLHMVKDDWPWRRLLHERPFTHEGNYLFLTVSTLSGWGSLERTNFKSFYFGKVWWPWKNWFLTVSTLGWCCGCERTDF